MDVDLIPDKTLVDLIPAKTLRFNRENRLSIGILIFQEQ